MSNVMTISKRTASGLEEVLRTLLLDAESKVPADRLRIVGALSEGAIIEQGSNSNGYWIRLANGTQICCGYRTFRPASNTAGTAIASEIYMYLIPITFPAAFVSVAAAISDFENNEQQHGWGGIYELSSSGATAAYYTTIATLGAQGGIGSYIVVGTWK